MLDQTREALKYLLAKQELELERRDMDISKQEKFLEWDRAERNKIASRIEAIRADIE